MPPIFELLPPADDPEDFTITITKEQIPYLNLFFLAHGEPGEDKTQFLTRMLVEKGLDQLQSDFDVAAKDSQNQVRADATTATSEEAQTFQAALEALVGG